MKKTLLFVFLFGMTAARAAVIVSSTAPSIGVDDIGKITFDSARNSDNDDQAHGSRAPGQYFTTGSDTNGYLLDAFSVKNRTYSSTRNFTVEVGTFTPGANEWSRIASQAFSSVTFTSSDWITFELDNLTYDSPALETTYKNTASGLIALEDASTYAVRIKADDWPFAWQNTNDNTVANAGWLNASGYNETKDRLFVAEMTVIPEPSSLALMLIAAAGFGMMVRRRKS